MAVLGYGAVCVAWAECRSALWTFSTVAARLAARSPGRAEATVQSDVRLLLLASGLNLREEHLEEVVLEAQVGKRRRIDVEVGATVFEVKRDLRVGNVHNEAIEQLAGYVRDRVETTGARYVGVLTDGTQWHLYHLDGTALSEVSAYTLDTSADSLDGLLVWLDGVLATSDHITPTPVEVTRRLGAGSPAFALDVADLTALYERHRSGGDAVACPVRPLTPAGPARTLPGMTKRLLAAALVAVSTVLLSVGAAGPAQADSNWPEREKGYGFIA